MAKFKEPTCPNCNRKMMLVTRTAIITSDGQVVVKFLCTKCYHEVFVDLKDLKIY